MVAFSSANLLLFVGNGAMVDLVVYIGVSRMNLGVLWFVNLRILID